MNNTKRDLDALATVRKCCQANRHRVVMDRRGRPLSPSVYRRS
jgi:hypothetical protein